MGVGPTHNCIVMFEGEALPTVLPAVCSIASKGAARAVQKR